MTFTVHTDGRIEVGVTNIGDVPIKSVTVKPYGFTILTLGAVQDLGICKLANGIMVCDANYAIAPGQTFSFTIKTYSGTYNGAYVWINDQQGTTGQVGPLLAPGPGGSPPPTTPPVTTTPSHAPSADTWVGVSGAGLRALPRTLITSMNFRLTVGNGGPDSTDVVGAVRWSYGSSTKIPPWKALDGWFYFSQKPDGCEPNTFVAGWLRCDAGTLAPGESRHFDFVVRLNGKARDDRGWDAFVKSGKLLVTGNAHSAPPDPNPRNNVRFWDVQVKLAEK